MSEIKSHFKAPMRQLSENIEGFVLDEVDGKEVPKNEVKCVLSKRSSAAALGLNVRGNTFLKTMHRKGIGAVIDEKLIHKLENPIIFKYIHPGAETHMTVHGYDTETFVDVLRVFMDARRKGVLPKSQEFIAENAEIMLVSLANTTLDAIIFQESGYWRTLENQAISSILDKYLQDNARKWAKTFPDEFWFKLMKVKGFPSYMALKRPGFVGHGVNDLVYARLASGVLQRLKEINPRTEKGYRKNKHFQHLTEIFQENYILN